MASPSVPVRCLVVTTVVLGILVPTVALVAGCTGSLSPSDVGDIRAAVADAILGLNRDVDLPPDVRPGHFTAADRARLRAASRANLAEHFADQALTNALTNHLEWIDRIASIPPRAGGSSTSSCASTWTSRSWSGRRRS